MMHFDNCRDVHQGRDKCTDKGKLGIMVRVRENPSRKTGGIVEECE